MMDEVYERHQFDVSALDCYNQLLDKLENDALVGLEIPIEEYASRLKIAIEDYIETNRIDENWIAAKKENAFLVNISESTFEWWLALYLTLVDAYKIPLILDHYQENWKDTNVEFVNFIQYRVLDIQEKGFFHDFKKNTKELVKWIRKTKKINSKQSQSKICYGQSTIIKSPFYEHLLNDLLEFCEEESKEDLKEVLKGGEIKDRVILSSNFKKISLQRPLRYLIGQQAVKKNQIEWAIWLFENFCIQSDKGLNQFSKHGSIKALSQPLKETKNSQIKFTSWLKE